MKANTVMPYLLRGERRTFEEVDDPVTGTTVREYNDYTEEVNIRLITGTQSRPVMYTKVPFKIWDLITNVRDLNDQQVLSEEGWFVFGYVPVVNPFGFSDGYAYVIKPVPAAGLETKGG